MQTNESLAEHQHVETLFWKRMTGTLYVSTSDETGTRTCFRASWVPQERQRH
jgi:hypothetical protein